MEAVALQQDVTYDNMAVLTHLMCFMVGSLMTLIVWWLSQFINMINNKYIHEQAYARFYCEYTNSSEEIGFL